MKLRVQLSAFFGAICGFLLVRAQTITWSASPGSGVFGTGANWLGGAAPVAVNDVVFSASNTASVDIGGATSVNSLTFNGTYPQYTVGSANASTLTIGAGGVLVDSGGPGAALQSGLSVALGANQTWTVNPGASLSVAGPVSGAFALTKAGTGTLVLSGANTYGGGTTVTAGTLQLNASGALPAGKPVTIAPTSGTATLNLNDTNQSIGALTLGGASGTNAMVSVTTNSTLTLGGDVTFNATSNPNQGSISEAGTLALGGDRTFNVGSSTATSGTGDLMITANITGSGDSLIKTGAGKLVLAGVNTYSGNTTINDGRLQMAIGGTLPASAVIVDETTAGGTATFDLGGTTQTVGSLTLRGAANSMNNVDLGPGGSLVLAGDVRYDATNNPGAATIWNGNSIVLGSSTRTFTVDQSSGVPTGDAELTIATGITGTAGLTKAGTGTLALTGNNTYSGPTTISAGTLQIGDGSAANTNLAGNITDNATLAFATNGMNFGGVISGTGAVNVIGDVTLTGANSYGGGTNVGASGHLTIGDGGVVPGNISDLGTVTFNQTGNLTYANVISGTGGLEQNGAGVLTLTGANSYSGPTSISVGTLKIGSDNALPAGSPLTLQGALDVAANQTLQQITAYSSGTVTIEPTATLTLFPAAGGMNFGSNIQGTGNLVINAPGTSVGYNGTNSLTGTTTVKAGTLDVSNNGGNLPASGALVVNATNGTYASVNMGDTTQTVGSLTFGGPGALAGALNSIQMDSGALVLGGNVTVDTTSSPSGAVISGGDEVDLGAAARTFNVGHSTSAGVDLTIDASLVGTVDLTKTGAGSLLLGQTTEGFSGNVTVNSGTLIVGADDATGTGILTLASGATLAAGLANPSGGGSPVPITIANPVALNDNVSVGTSGWNDPLTLIAATTLPGNATVHLASGQLVTLGGSLSGPAGNATLTFDGGGVAVLGGAVTNLSSITANGSAVIVGSTAVLSGSSAVLKAGTGSTSTTNLGYVGLGATSLGATPTVADVVAHVDKSNFNGTLGFDTSPGGTSVGAHEFSDAIDLTGFNANVTLGSTTNAILSGSITPAGGNYAFGNGGGVLFVTSNLGGTYGLSVVSSSALKDNALGVVLQGSNTFSGAVNVANSLLVLDSPNAVPTGTTFSLGAFGYLGATETYGSAFNLTTFLSRITGYTSTSVLGFDSTTYVNTAKAAGTGYGSRYVTGTVDLRSLSPIYLGTATSATFSGPLYAPAGGNLALVAVGQGTLTVSSSIGPGNASQVTVGSTQIGGGKGTVELSGVNSYPGGTTLASGRLQITQSSRSTASGVVGSLGSGTLTVAPGANNPALVGPATTSNPAVTVVQNPIALNANLRVGDGSSVFFGDTTLSDFFASLDRIVLNGTITNGVQSGSLELYGATVLNGSNSFSGGVTWHPGVLEVGSDSALGTGVLTLTSAGFNGLSYAIPFDFVADGNRTFANAVSVQSGTATILQVEGTGSLSLGDSTHPISLGNDLTVQPGLFPVYLNGNVIGPGKLIIDGANAVVLNGTSNSYGGTEVDQGAAIFASAASIPVGQVLIAQSDGYIGVASSAGLGGSNLQSAYINRFDQHGSMNGTIGFDSPVGGPTSTFSGDIDETNFYGTPRLGSATTALLTGNITVSSDYQFGGGGGELTVQSALADQGGKGVQVDSPSLAPLTLVLTGNNTYSGATWVGNSAVVFSAGALANSGTVFTLANEGAYAGLQLGTDTTGSDPTITSFLARFGELGNGYVGFDAGGGSTITNLDLSALGGGSFGLATTSQLTLGGTLAVGSSLSTYRLAGFKGGALTIGSVLADGSGARSVIIGDTAVPATFGTPTDPTAPRSSVTLSGNNTYTGGTTLEAGVLNVGDDHALGSGMLSIANNSTPDGRHLGLFAVDGARSLTNAIALGSAALDIGGTDDLALGGVLSGSGELFKVGSGLLTMSGDSTAFSGGYNIQQGSVKYVNGPSVGTGAITFGTGAVGATFLDTSTVNGISSDPGATPVITLPVAGTLTINQTDDGVYGGSFGGTTAGLAFTGTGTRAPVQLTLSGSSSYSGPTSIGTGVAVAAQNAAAFGLSSNSVTLSGGTLIVGSGVTLPNPLTTSSGTLRGTGTVASAVTIGNGMTLAPGTADAIGSLHFDSTLTLADGGIMQWRLLDAATSSGSWDQVQVNGAVTVASGATPFTFQLIPFATSLSSIPANFNPFTAASWVVMTATSFPGFDASKFRIDTSAIPTTILAGGTFSLSLNGAGTNLMLNFTPVPEPATYALMLAGLGIIGWVWRRRRAS
ncbi:MAG TPA: autotransporter-associated beta strand repeat-containing protein [Opitutaceae bacterium]|nr:autotransporter-associated beta strand repeat-containing protein [Opitutaceae bacterium]